MNTKLNAFHNAINTFKRQRIRLLSCLGSLFKKGPLALEAQIIQINNYQHDDYWSIFERLSHCNKELNSRDAINDWYGRIKILARSIVWLARTFSLFQSRKKFNFTNQVDYLFIDYAPSKECIRNTNTLNSNYWGNLKAVIPKDKTTLNLTIPTNRKIWNYAFRYLQVKSNNFKFQKIMPTTLLTWDDFLSIVKYFLKSLVLSIKFGFIPGNSNFFCGRLINLWSRTIISPNFLQDLCIELSLKKLNVTEETVVIYLCEFNTWELIVTRYYNTKKVKKIIAFDHTFLRAQDLRWQSLDSLPEDQATLYCPTWLAVSNKYSEKNIKKFSSILSAYVTQVEALRFPDNKISQVRRSTSSGKQKICIFFEISFGKCEALLPSIEKWIESNYPKSKVFVKFHPGFSKSKNHLDLSGHIDMQIELNSKIENIVNEVDVAICIGSTSVLAMLAETNVLVYHCTSLVGFNFCVLPDEYFDERHTNGLMLIRRLANSRSSSIFFRHPDFIRWRGLLGNV